MQEPDERADGASAPPGGPATREELLQLEAQFQVALPEAGPRAILATPRRARA